MMKSILRTSTLASLLLLFCAQCALCQDFRLWSAEDANFKLVGKIDLARVFNENNVSQTVYIVDENGLSYQIELDELSAQDKRYVADVARIIGSTPDYQEALDWLKDQGRASGARRTIKMDGIEYSFRWIAPGKYAEPAEEYNPNSLKAVAAARAANKKNKAANLTQSTGFWCLETEVTLEMYSQFVKSAKYKPAPTQGRKLGYVGEPQRVAGVKLGEEFTWQKPGFPQVKTQPVTLVTKADAQAFCKWLAKRLDRNIKLPTRSQWLLASQPVVNPTADYFNVLGNWAFGSKEGWERGNLPDANFPVICPIQSAVMDRVNFTFRDSNRFTAPVASFAPNANGLHDMIGNVGEMVSDSDDVVESLGGSWFHIQNFNPINWKHVDSLSLNEPSNLREYAASLTAPRFAQQYDQSGKNGGYGGNGYGDAGYQNDPYAAMPGNSGGGASPFLYQPVENVDATCFTGFRVIIE